MSRGHFGSTFQTYDLHPQATHKKHMYVSYVSVKKCLHITSQEESGIVLEYLDIMLEYFYNIYK